MEIIEQALQGEFVLKVLFVVFCANAALSGLKIALEKIADHTKTDLDNNALKVVTAILSGVQKLLDFAGYNPAHKPTQPPKQ